MKRLIYLAILFFSIISFTSCEKEDKPVDDPIIEPDDNQPVEDDPTTTPSDGDKPVVTPTEGYVVTFNSMGGSQVKAQTVNKGTKAVEPQAPTRQNYIFKGWCIDSDGTKPFNFDTAITKNTTLYAKWTSTTNPTDDPKPVGPTDPTDDPKPVGPTNPSGDKVVLSFTDAYYKPLNGDLDNNFKSKLHELLEETHDNRGSYSKAWTVLKACDEDPNNSRNIICIYTGKSIPKANQDSGSSGNNIWNREHLWPKAKGFKTDGIPAHNDCHHLHASEKNINNYRGNLDFGEVANPTNSDSYGNRWNSTYFEPRDEVKGDIARSLFYMVVRYDGDLCGSCELDCELVNGSVSSSSSSSGKVGRLGDLATLLKWHYEDPVDENERRRNDIVCSYQGNRNPFIDHEEFVSYIYPELVGKYTDISNLSYLF